MTETKNKIGGELPAKTHEQFLTSVVDSSAVNLDDTQIHVSWWPADSVRDFFTIDACVGPVCAVTRKKDETRGSLIYDSDKLVYYGFEISSNENQT